jgi:hypothetical protein
LAALGLLGGLVVVGLLAVHRTWEETLIQVSFGVGFLCLVGLWSLTLRKSGERPPLSPRRKIWHGVVFLLWLLVMAGVVFWYFADREGRNEGQGKPADVGAEP